VNDLTDKNFIQLLFNPIMFILATIRAILVFGGMVMYILLYGISCLFYKHTPQRAFRLRKHYLSYWCNPVLNIQIEKKGSVIDQPSLYVCNHRSFADPIVLCKYLDAYVIAKAEVMHYPIINKGAELTGVLWVNRQDQQSRTTTRDKMVETIENGFNVLVYPEGTVGKEPKTLPFRKGTFMEAGENGIPVVPVAIEFKSKRDLWVLEKFLPQYFYQFSKWKTEVKLSFGQPIFHKDGEHLHQAAFQWINAEIHQMQKGWSTAFTAE
jgi:1-acyl-sn-glycerol-3-phosphate acyltransferase